MIPEGSDRSQNLQDENEPKVQNVRNDIEFAFNKTRKSLTTTEGFTFSSEYGNERKRIYLEIEQHIDRMDDKNRQKYEVSVSEHFDGSDLNEMTGHILKSPPKDRLQQSKNKLNNYKMQERKLGHILNSHPLNSYSTLKNDYSTIKYAADISEYIDILHGYIFEEYSENSRNTEYPAYKRMSSLYPNSIQNNNYKYSRYTDNNNKLKYVIVENSTFDDKVLLKMRENDDEDPFESNLSAEDRSKILYIYIFY